MKYSSVLLVDDDENSNFINDWVIRQSFAENIITKQSAVSALEFLKSQSKFPENLPDFIFLDIRMPVMDGFGFLQEFNNLPLPVKEKCKIVVLSSSFNKNDYNKVMKNKYVYKYLKKPLSVEALTDI